MQHPDGDDQAPTVGWNARQREVVIAVLPSLLSTALVHSGDHGVAEALVEATLRAAARDVPDEEDPRAWLHAHLWARVRELGDHDGHDPIGPASGRRRAGDRHGTLREAVATLPAQARAAVHLVDVEELSYAQLARVLGTNRAEAAASLHDARRRLVPAVTAATTGPAGAVI